MSLTIDDGHAMESADARMPAPLNLWHDDRPLPAWVQALANDFDVDDLVEVIIGRCLSIAFPNQAHDDDFREYLTASTSANARCLRSVIAGEIALEDVYLETGVVVRQSASAAAHSAEVDAAVVSDQLLHDVGGVERSPPQGHQGRRRRPRRGGVGAAAADPDDPGLSGFRGLPGRRDLHPRLRGAQQVSRAYAPQPGQGHPSRRERCAVRLRRRDPDL